MATLDKIFISGIRSYGIEKNDAQSLNFHKPVTLFLGQNGCGKTTILECVKYALTGDFPFGTKTGGHAFVADPHLHNVNSIKGVIKLQFNDVFGNPATISKALKLEVQGSKMKAQAMDTSYKYIDPNGLERKLSVKISDGKEMIIRLLGVSESILNNVLFCHQDEGLWPLAEDGAVKKKFDMIFNSAKVDAFGDVLIKKLKSHTEALKSLKKELALLGEIKTDLKCKRESLAEKQHNKEILKNEVRELEQLLTPKKAKLQEVYNLQGSISALTNVKNSTENEIKSNQSLQESIKGLIKYTFEGSDEELAQEISSFHKRFLEKKAELTNVECNIVAVKNEAQKIVKQQQDKRSIIAGLQERIKGYKQLLNSRDLNVCNLLAEYKKEACDNFEENFSVLQQVFGTEKTLLENKRKSFEREEAAVQKQIDSAQDIHMKVKSECTVKQRELEAVTEDIRTAECQLEELSASDLEFKNYQAKITRVESEIEELMSSFNEDTEMTKIEENKRNVRGLKDKLEELEEELKKLMKNSFTDKEIETLESDISDKERHIRKEKSQHHREFNSVFPDGLPTKDLKGEVRKIQDDNYNELETLKKDLALKQKEVSTKETSLAHEKVQLLNIKQEFEESQGDIAALCGTEPFNKKLAQVLEQNKLLQKEKGQLSSMRIIYREFIKELNDKKCCPVCETDFSSKHEMLQRLALSMNTKIDKIPERLERVSKKLAQGEKLHNDLLQLKPVHKKMSELEANIRDMQMNLDNAQVTLKILNKKMDDLKHASDAKQKMYNACVKVIGSAAFIDQYTYDISKAATKIAELKTKLLPIQTNRNKANTETLIEETKEEIQRLGEDSERISKRTSMNQKRLHELRTKKNELTDSQLKLESLVQGKPQIIKKLDELVKKEKVLTEEIEDVEIKLAVALADIQVEKDHLKQIQTEQSKQLSLLNQQLMSHNIAMKDIEKMQRDVTKMEGEQLADQCTIIENQIEVFNKQLDGIKQQMAGCESQREQLKDELRDQDITDKSLQNNKKLRDLKKDERRLEDQLTAISKDIGSKNNAALDAERSTLHAEITSIENKLSNIKGQLQAIQENINDLNEGLTRYNVDPFKTYVKKLAEIEVMNCFIKECKQLNELISIAICKYHREKLLSINMSLKDLWMEVYRGNDIDYIQIESGETVVTGGRRRIYSYRVMQKKGDIRLPMRSKCSAGQKVLACLLVRIALAESFSTQCGIFALDEPTTNLDRENIRSLSQCIASLVCRGSKQKNFQFLIITHDEEFLNALRETDALREFYRVTRNLNGNTIITKETI